MRIFQTTVFKKAVKKLHANQKNCLDNAVEALLSNPLLVPPSKLSTPELTKVFMS
jgi:hypothetical protein